VSAKPVRRTPHLCHAFKCGVSIEPRKFMCPMHWRRLPAPLRAAILAAYKPGQEVTKDPSPAYLAVTSFASGLLAMADHGARAAAPYGDRARRWRQQCITWRRPDPLAGLTALRVHMPVAQQQLAGGAP